MMATKNPTVTKKQLEESGFDNLRDYMNAERGLMRKDGKVALRKGDMDIKSAAEKRSATRMADVAAKKPQADRRSDTRLKAGKASSASSKAANMMTDGDEASSLSSAVMSGEARKRRAGKDNATNAALADRYNSIQDSGSGYKKGGAMKSKMMASGGKALAAHAAKPASKAHAGLKAGGMMKHGGSVHASKMGKVKTNSRVDGVAERGLTKARKPVMKTMARGGKTY
jgi:hypothetical protein